MGASTITINYSGTGQLTYVTAPGTSASQDSFAANIVDATYGAGTLIVSGDVTNYLTGTGSSPANSAVITFTGGTLTGSTASLLNFANGAANITYTVTGGTGLFLGRSGTIFESAQFTSLGSFIPDVPANVSILLATGSLVAPEPTTAAAGLFGGGAILLVEVRRRRRIYPN